MCDSTFTSKINVLKNFFSSLEFNSASFEVFSENVESSVKKLLQIVLFDILSLLCNKARSDSDVCSSVYRDVNLMILSQWKVDLHADLFHVGDHSVINSCCSWQFRKQQYTYDRSFLKNIRAFHFLLDTKWLGFFIIYNFINFLSHTSKLKYVNKTSHL